MGEWSDVHESVTVIADRARKCAGERGAVGLSLTVRFDPETRLPVAVVGRDANGAEIDGADWAPVLDAARDRLKEATK